MRRSSPRPPRFHGHPATRARMKGHRGSESIPLSTAELQEAGRGQECPVAGVILAGGILALQPGIAEQALSLRQPQPVGRLPDQPRGDPAAGGAAR